MTLIWSFFIYSFGGYLLEKGFAHLRRSPRRKRKAFLLAPLCPAYGLAMLLALSLGGGKAEHWWEQMLVGGSAATAVEYGLHWFYERVFGVRFWDYSTLRFELGGRVALPFSLLWGILSFVALRFLQPGIEVFSSRAAPALTGGILLFLAVDAMYSARVLWFCRDPEQLSLAALRLCI